jgi:hypothetical protein
MKRGQVEIEVKKIESSRQIQGQDIWKVIVIKSKVKSLTFTLTSSANAL